MEVRLRFYIIIYITRTFQEVSINSLVGVKGCPETTCWKVLVYMTFPSLPERSEFARLTVHVSLSTPGARRSCHAWPPEARQESIRAETAAVSTNS